MDPALWELLRAGDEGQEVAAIVRLHDTHRRVCGVRIVARFGPIATCRLRLGDVLDAWLDPNVISLKAARALGPQSEPDDEPPLRRLPAGPVASDTRRPPGLSPTGAGVLIGIADWGCDFAHGAFRRPDGTTRLCALWDQRRRGGAGSPRPYGYGALYRAREIDDALRSDDPYGALGYHPAEADLEGTGTHGTHVMDIAAGGGGDGLPAGIAPEADLAFVHVADWGTSGLANLGDSTRILEAVDFLARVAGRRPWVINLCIGRHGGPHDGCTLAELALDNLLSAGRGRCIVQSAGNYYDKRVHASGRLEQGETRRLTVITDEGDLTPNELEIWYGGRAELAIRVESPTGWRSRWVGLGDVADVSEDGRTVGRLYHRDGDPNNDDKQIELFLQPSAPAGRWAVSLRASLAGPTEFHAWLERDEACGACQARFADADVDTRCTTGTIANGRLPLVVGAYDAHSPGREAAPFTSEGPTRDCRTKPDLAAPGMRVLAARSAPWEARESPGAVTRKSGTSMAAPWVTGAVALCMQAAARPLACEEIRALVLGTVERAGPAARIGRGYLDIGAAVSALTDRDMPHDNRGVDMASLDPDRVYRAIARRTSGGPPAWMDDDYEIVARPWEMPVVPPEDGDLLIRVVLGRPGLGNVCRLTSSTLAAASALAAQDVAVERGGAGSYVAVDDGRIARRVLDRAGRMPGGQLLLRPRIDRLSEPVDEGEVLTEGDPFEDIVARIEQELALRFTDPNDPGLVARRGRLRALFAGVPPARAGELAARLGTRPTADPLSRAFHGRLATATRDQLLRILREPPPPAQASPEPTPTAPPQSRSNPCERGVGSMTLVLPWEREMLAIANGREASAFEGVGLLVGPILPPGVVGNIQAMIVSTALKHGYAITIGNNVWFPSALDTSTLEGICLLVHESVHVVDYAAAGIEAFLTSYVQKAVVAGFNHDGIPDEKRANRIEEGARRMLVAHPRLMDLIRSCDGAAILAELRNNRDAYTRAILAALPAEGEAEAAESDRGDDIEAVIRKGLAENEITDTVFFARNPGLPRQPLKPDTEAARQWLAIRDVEVRPAAKRMVHGGSFDPILLATYLSQWEGDRWVSDEATETFLTGPPLLSLGRTLRDRVLWNWRAGHRPLTLQAFYNLALGVAGEPATALLIAHNVSRSFARGGKSIQWANGPHEAEYLIGNVTVTAKVVHPDGTLTYTRGGRTVRSIFYLLFSARELGTEDPGDWYHHFVTATLAISGAASVPTSRERSGDAEGDRTGPGGRVVQAGYELLVANAVLDLESQLTRPAFRGAPGYRGWVLANAISFLEGGYYGEAEQANVSRESRVHVRGAVFGLRVGGWAANPAWRWSVPIAHSLDRDELVAGFSAPSKTYETLDPRGRTLTVP